MADKIAKGRNTYIAHPGVKNGRAKLTEADVHEIRRAYTLGELDQVKLAAKFKIANQLVSRIIAKQAWKHL